MLARVQTIAWTCLTKTRQTFSSSITWRTAFFHAALVKRDIDLGKPQQIEIAPASARAAERKIGLPGFFVVLLHPSVELKGAHLRQRVVHIVERVEEDMLLLHPESALFEERHAVVIPPWADRFARSRARPRGAPWRSSTVFHRRGAGTRPRSRDREWYSANRRDAQISPFPPDPRQRSPSGKDRRSVPWSWSGSR